MDKLSEHAIRMLEIEGKGKNDGYIETRNMGDIARAVYDTILQVQMLKTALLHKTEPTGYNLSPVEDEATISKMEQVEDEPQTCDNCKLKGSTKWCNNQVVCRAYKPKDEPQTDCAWR